MTLLELDERLNFILEFQKNNRKHDLNDLSKIVFYGVSYGYGVRQSNKIKEEEFHNIIARLLTLPEDQTKNSSEQDPEEALRVLG